MGWAADKRAELARKEWESYKETYIPLENRLIDLIGNEQELDAALGQADLSVRNAFSSSRDQFARDLSRRGVSMSALEREQLGRESNLAETAARVEAANRVRQRDFERDTQTIGGGLSGIVQRGGRQGAG